MSERARVRRYCPPCALTLVASKKGSICIAVKHTILASANKRSPPLPSCISFLTGATTDAALDTRGAAQGPWALFENKNKSHIHSYKANEKKTFFWVNPFNTVGATTDAAFDTRGAAQGHWS